MQRRKKPTKEGFVVLKRPPTRSRPLQKNIIFVSVLGYITKTIYNAFVFSTKKSAKKFLTTFSEFGKVVYEEFEICSFKEAEKLYWQDINKKS